jgi:hypothetical protein
MTDIYEHFDPLVGETRSTVAGLPGSGNWIGRTIYVQETKTVYVCTALPWTWVPAAVAGQRLKAVPVAGSTNSNGIVVVPNPFAPTPPTAVFVQEQQGPLGENQIRTIQAVVWDRPLAANSVQVRFRAEDTNLWAPNQAVVASVLFALEPA